MPPAKTARKRAAKPAVEDDELEGIDEELAALESATDLDDLDVDEPDDEEQEDEEEAKPAAKRKKAAAKKAAPEPEEDEEEEDDEESDEEEEGEDEEPEPDEFEDMDRTELKAYNKEQELGIVVKKSMTDDDLREVVRTEAKGKGLVAEDEEEDEEPAEEQEAAPAKKTRGRPKGSGANPPRAAKQPTDEPILSVDDVAAIGGLAEHQVRAFARKYPKAFPKASPKAQYRFNPKQARAILKGLGALAE